MKKETEQETNHKIGFIELFISIGGIIATVIGLGLGMFLIPYLLKRTDVSDSSTLIGLGAFLIYEITWIFVALNEINK
jgi:hypothetical protein